MGANDAGFCLEATQGRRIVRSRTKTMHGASCHPKGLDHKQLSLSTAEPAVEGPASHRGSVIAAKESQHFSAAELKSGCTAQGCLLNSAFSHRQICRGKGEKLISKTGRYLGK